MSVCSSISGNSGSLSDDEFGQMNRNAVGNKSCTYPFSPPKSSRMNFPTRSRPGVQRSDHTSASVQQLEFDDSCASFYSSASSATASSNTMSTQFRSLSRKESISPLKRSSIHSTCLDMSKSISTGCCDTASTHTSPTRSSSSNNSIRAVRFAPLSENLYVPTPCLDEMTKEEIESAWFSSKDYEEQRIDYQRIVVQMEQEMQLSTGGEITTAAFTSAVKAIEGARGLEHRTKVGTRTIFQNRQQSIQAVLKEQEHQNKDFIIRTDRNVLWKQTSTSAIATAYSMETMMSVLDAVERAMYDAKEADVVISDPTLYELISPRSRNKRSISSSSFSLNHRFASETHNSDIPPSNVSRKPVTRSSSNALMNSNQRDCISDSLHTMSALKKRGYQPRPTPQRTPSSSFSSLMPSGARRNTLNRNLSFRTAFGTTAPPLPSIQSRGEHSLASSTKMLSLDTAASALCLSNHRHMAHNKESLLQMRSKSSHSKSTTPSRQNSNDSNRGNNSRSYSTRHIVV